MSLVIEGYSPACFPTIPAFHSFFTLTSNKRDTTDMIKTVYTSSQRRISKNVQSLTTVLLNVVMVLFRHSSSCLRMGMRKFVVWLKSSKSSSSSTLTTVRLFYLLIPARALFMHEK